MSDRKYRQRGYLDDDRGTTRPAAKPSAPIERDGPRGRGLGRPEREVFRCRDCGREVTGEVVPASACAQCGAALHACVNCRNFDPNARWECRAEIPAPVRSKAKPNDCSLYVPKTVLELGTKEKAVDDPRAAFDALFR